MIEFKICNPENTSQYYVLQIYPENESIWFKNQDSEGCGHDIKKFYDYIDKFFKQVF